MKEIWELEQSFAWFLFIFKKNDTGNCFSFTKEVWKLTQLANSLFSENNCLISALYIIFYEVLKALLGLVCCWVSNKYPLRLRDAGDQMVVSNMKPKKNSILILRRHYSQNKWGNSHEIPIFFNLKWDF